MVVGIDIKNVDCQSNDAVLLCNFEPCNAVVRLSNDDATKEKNTAALSFGVAACVQANGIGLQLRHDSTATTWLVVAVVPGAHLPRLKCWGCYEFISGERKRNSHIRTCRRVKLFFVSVLSVSPEQGCCLIYTFLNEAVFDLCAFDPLLSCCCCAWYLPVLLRFPPVLAISPFCSSSSSRNSSWMFTEWRKWTAWRSSSRLEGHSLSAIGFHWCSSTRLDGKQMNRRQSSARILSNWCLNSASCPLHPNTDWDPLWGARRCPCRTCDEMPQPHIALVPRIHSRTAACTCLTLCGSLERWWRWVHCGRSCCIALCLNELQTCS